MRPNLDPDTHVEFNAAIDRFESDDDIWLAVLTGAGERSFCAGRDLKQLAEIGRYRTVGGDETYYMEAAYTMLTSGDWLVPRYVTGELRLEKPGAKKPGGPAGKR